ncbi:MAG: 23S rRNA (uracil(1939)-C(5))-methyltransferase RlmD [Oscillospiraceae bacterium]|nr:23S rRNA (uracil(1939)-C(5))-methyltransferase RlmD [Oscillospiraceae bacterium]
MSRSREAAAAPVRKNQIIPLEITGMTAEGQGVGHFCGLAVFAAQAAVGDVLDVRIVKVLKNLAYGIIETIRVPSPDRVQPVCGVFPKCGGCTFQHISYEAECRIKAQIVSDAFSRIGHLKPKELLPVFGAENPTGYRNKAQYPCGTAANGKSPCFGFYAPRSHRLIPVVQCMLQPEVFGEILLQCQRALGTAQFRLLTPYNEETGAGVLRHLYLRQGHHSGEIMVCFVSAKDTQQVTDAFRQLGETLMQSFPAIRSVMLNCNPQNTNVILGKKTVSLCGSARISDTLCGVPVSLSPQSFYQVNTAQAERLFAEAKRLAAPQKHELLLDLYCGAGAIGLSMADAVGRVIGVEVVPEAITDAKENAARAGITNAEFFCGDAGEIAARFAAEGTKPDIIVLDPPRKGCDSRTLDACLQMAPSRIVMISCNPATAARDAAYLCANGFSLDVLRPADFFPRSGHVECVSLLTR